VREVRTLAVQAKFEIRKQRILDAAERIFAQKGFQEATVSDVAREAGVSDATIYEYFPSKEELLFSIPGEIAIRGKENLENILNHVRDTRSKIRSIVYHYLWFYETHPDYSSVVLLVLKPNRRFLETDAYKDVRQMSRLILGVLEEGIASGELRPDADPRLVRSLMLGVIEHNVIRKSLLGAPKNLLELVDPITDLIMEGAGPKPLPREWNLRITAEPGPEASAPRKPVRRKKKADSK
jgi:TetR/AcrR family transcriptional regulator, fatty acid metabolism regulator protein